MNTSENLLPRAIKYAISAHASAAHMYDDAPYSVHLALAAHYADMFSHLIPSPYKENALCAVWLHDTIEDCRISYNDLKKVFGEEIAETVYAVTNLRGRTRAERANDEYYSGIRNTPYAPFVKLCDRMANVKYSISMGNEHMMEVYKNEMDDFLVKIHPVSPSEDYTEMEEHLKEMIR